MFLQMFAQFQENRRSNLCQTVWFRRKAQVSVSDVFTDNFAAGFVHIGSIWARLCVWLCLLLQNNVD